MPCDFATATVLSVEPPSRTVAVVTRPASRASRMTAAVRCMPTSSLKAGTRSAMVVMQVVVAVRVVQVGRVGTRRMRAGDRASARGNVPGRFR